MKLADAIALFLEQAPGNKVHARQLQRLIEYFTGDARIAVLTPARLGAFFGHWYIARIEQGILPKREAEPNACADAERLLEAVDQFLQWCALERQDGISAECRSEVTDARFAIRRALEISEALANSVDATRGGAFEFPGLLTTFEEGGRSHYDFDHPVDRHDLSEPASIEGYFRIVNVEGNLVEAMDVLGETSVRSIVFAPSVAALLGRDYIVELDLIKDGSRWKINGCGFAYPPCAFPREN